MSRSWRTDGRWIAVAILLAYAAALALAARGLGPDRVSNAAGIPPMGAHFSDLYPFPAARAELARGGDPYTSNPFDPWGRVLNCPRLWLQFMRFSWGAIPAVGAAMGAAWLAALLAVLGPLSRRQGILAGVLLASAPVVLALERANTDLIIFLLAAGGLAALRRDRPAAAGGLLLAASLLKFYPIAAFAAFLVRGWRRALPWIAGAGLLLAAWVLAQVSDVRTIAHNTPAGGAALSYGAGVVLNAADLLHYGRTGQWADFSRHARALDAAAGLLGAALAALGWRRGGAGGAGRELFQAGAGVYLLTFLLGSNFVYREIFLLLCLPRLWGAGADAGLRRAALACLAVSLLLHPMWGLTPALTLLRQAANWALFGLLAWLGGAAANARENFRSNPEAAPV
ncbi:MAG TPA: hypothetical protein VHC86_01960 [Opitutaceae bacterium]|nr:hypothetical protein [Opitutaceae bacterium]